MLFNVALEAVIGVVPIIGDVFDATFKANARNVELLNQAVSDAHVGRNQRKNADRGFVLMVVGALLALLVVIGGAGIAVFSWVASQFR